MARHEGRLQAEREATGADMRLLLGPAAVALASAAERQEAIVCLLSASEGWHDACSRAGGAFADEGRDETGLKVVNEE